MMIVTDACGPKVESLYFAGPLAAVSTLATESTTHDSWGRSALSSPVVNLSWGVIRRPLRYNPTSQHPDVCLEIIYTLQCH